MMKTKFILCAASIFLLMHIASAQTAQDKTKLYQKSPEWIAMMDDTLTNYFEAQKAFDIYWSIRPLPVEEDDIIGHTEMKPEKRSNWLSNIFKSRKEKRAEESERYAFQYKKFNNWLRAMYPYVQEDGSILTPSQRMAIWEQQKKDHQ